MIHRLLELTPCGLIFDAIGVSLLGYAFFMKSKEAIIQEAGTYWNSNPYVLRSIVATKFDGIFGSALLLIGFIYQALGYAGVQLSELAVASYIALTISILGYFSFIRSWLITRWVEGLERVINKSGS